MPVKTPGLFVFFCLATAALMAPHSALAATEAHGAITSIGAAVASPNPSAFSQMIAWIFEQQRAFHRELTQGLQSLRAGGGVKAALGLILASFLYGVFHAAGPGHGKAVLTAYLLTHKQRVARGIGLAAAAALCQGITALVLVYGLIGLAGWLPRETSTAVVWSERLSYVLVFLVGALLAIRAARGLVSMLRPKAPPHLLLQASTGDLAYIDGHNHQDRYSPQHGDAQGCDCGHVHAPSAEQIAQATDIRTTLGLILSIGLRPCSGAILVLVFAQAMSLAGAGVAAIAAMSTGTALAVASLAFLAVNARQWAASMAGARRSRYRAIAGAVALGGGLLVMMIGLSLITASFAPPHPLGLS